MKTIEWINGKVRLIDQTKLPFVESFLETNDYRELVSAIKEMRIRGAPAIGVAGAYAIATGTQEISTGDKTTFHQELDRICQVVASTRPTAVNLYWAIERMKDLASKGNDIAEIKAALLNEARKMEAEDESANRRLAKFGAELIEDGFTILTHCNAGALATVAYGTAVGVIRAAHEQGKRIHVYADETRPLLQGARLTVWELMKDSIPVTLITDSMAGYFMKKGIIDCVIVGGDRIAANGDVANKIGTYALAVLAMENGIPFYVAVPTSTIDLAIASGTQIPIEERSPEEVTHIEGLRIAPEGVAVCNPAFDVSPHYYISAIITEKGIAREPYQETLKRLF